MKVAVVLLLAVGVVSFGLMVFGLWLLLQDRLRTPRSRSWVPPRGWKPPPPAPPPPPPTPARRFETALRQAAHRAFTTWWKTQRMCPACGADAWFVGPKRDEQAVEVHSPTRGRTGFIAWTQDIGCRACGWRRSFPHTDSSPIEPETLRLDDAAIVPTRWLITTSLGAPMGTIVADRTGVRIEPAPEVDRDGRAGLAITAAEIGAVVGGIEPGLPDDERDRIRAWVLDQLAQLRGVRVTPG